MNSFIYNPVGEKDHKLTKKEIKVISAVAYLQKFKGGYPLITDPEELGMILDKNFNLPIEREELIKIVDTLAYTIVENGKAHLKKYAYEIDFTPVSGIGPIRGDAEVELCLSLPCYSTAFSLKTKIYEDERIEWEIYHLNPYLPPAIGLGRVDKLDVKRIIFEKEPYDASQYVERTVELLDELTSLSDK